MSTNDIEDVYPLSPMQQGMLFYTLYDPQSGAYVEQLRCTLRGNLNVAVFQRAWQHVVDRHPVLRSAYVWKNVDRPLQAVGRNVGVPLEQHDWQGLPAAEQERRLTTFLAGDRARGFKLSQGPLMRLTIFQVAEDAYCVVWSYHHMLLDGWSQQLVMNEVFACYAAFVRGREIQLARPRPYRDYITWLQQQDLAAAEVFWRALLRGFTAATPLVVDRLSRQDDGADGYAEQRLQLAQATASALQALTRRCGLTMNTLVQGAWALLLSRYSGETDVVFGATVSGRPPGLKGMDRMIGLFINTLPVRIRVPPEPPALSWLKQLQAQHVELRQYEYSPLVQVEGWSDVPRGQPLFESIVVFENYPVAAPTLEHDQFSLDISSAAGAGQTNYPLTVIGLPGPRLTIAISYDRRRFDAPTIERMLGHLRTLLESMAARPEQRLGELSLLGDAERGELLRLWKVPQPQHSHELCIHQLFEAQVERTPDAVALIFNDRRPTTDDRRPTNDQRPTTNDQRSVVHPFTPSLLHPFTPSPLHPFTCQHLTYQELNRRANNVAHELRALGVGPEVRVGICAERSPELIAGLLGILKAGGAYVPLDPAYPQERLAFMLADAQVAVLLTTNDQRPTTNDHRPKIEDGRSKIEDRRSPAFHPRSSILDPRFPIPIDLRADWDSIARQPADNLPGAAAADNLAYVIYTSGSTGAPRGVMAHHRGLVNFVLAMVERIDLRPGQRFLQFASFSFDASVLQVFPTLASGAALVLHEHPARLSIYEFLALCSRLQITILDLPAAFWQQWISDLATRNLQLPASVQTYLTGGERVVLDHVRTWAGLAGHAAQLLSSYGPTEATVTTMLSHTTGAQVDHLTLPALPLGELLANTQIYLLDRHMQPVPIGVPGEIFIGGAGVTRGYLHHPDLTAERFLPNPFAEGMGDGGWGMGVRDPAIPHPPSPIPRLYRTGDLARSWPDGMIEFLGRLDQQVKIRGYRVEPGEIEAALAQHPAVREAVVIAREEAPGDVRLVAYVVPKIEDRRLKIEDSNLGSSERLSSIFYPLSSELRDFLQERLPDYMLPAAFVALDALPLTPSGKLDRRALPAIGLARPGQAESFVPPRTPVEELLTGIWAQILKVEQVGIHDNFFALGGDSILSIQIIAKAHQAGLHLTPKQLFEHQTIAELALVVGAAPAVATEQGAVEGPVPLTPIQHWFFDQQWPDPQHFNQALLLTVRRPLAPRLLEQALRHLLRHHDALRLRFVRAAKGWQQLHAGREVRQLLVQIDLAALPSAQQTAAVEAVASELQTSLDLAQGPLVRVALFEHGHGRPGRLLIIVHHLVIDGVSWRVLLEDLQTAYDQLSRGELVALPSKTTSFKEWATRLADYVRSAELSKELDYWLAEPRRRVSRMPVDFTDGSNSVASARTVAIALNAQETRALLTEVPAVYRTQINDLLLTALAQVFARWTGERALLVDLEGHGREELFDGVDLSRTVGWFTTIYPVLLDLPSMDAPGAALKAIKEQLRAVPQHGIGYGALRHLSGEAATQLRALPAAEISFNYLGQVDQILSDTGPLELTAESSGPAQSPRGMRPYLIEINGIIGAGQLRLVWTYSEQKHRHATVERLAQAYLAALRGLIAHCLSPQAGGYTPSDFPLARLDQPTLDRLVGTDRQIEEIYPLAPIQQGMLFHTLYEPRSGVYVQQLGARFDGDLDVAIFQRAWQHVIDRHPIFRMTFAWEALDEPLQIVHRQARLPWELEDWREAHPAEQEARLAAFLQADRARGFDLAHPPLMRMALFRVAESSYHFIWSSHHILLDGWSAPLVLDEVFAHYAAQARGQAVQLTTPRPYRDYIAWLQQQDLAAAEAFWRRTLAGLTAPTQPGAGHPPDQEASAADYAEQSLQLSEATTAALHSLARQFALTLSTLVHGAWAMLLSRYSGEPDVVFGTTVSGRPPELAGSEAMVGLFINTLPLRVRVAPELAALPWLQQLQARHAELRQYEYSPLVQVQGWSEIPRGLPLFESIVVFENYPLDSTLHERHSNLGLTIRDVRAVEQTNYPLTLSAGPGARLPLKIIYDQRRFDAAMIARMLRHLQTVLDGIAADSSRRLADLPLLTDAERRQQAAWNATAREFRSQESEAESIPADSWCLHKLIEAQVARAPDAVAVVFDVRTTNDQRPTTNDQRPTTNGKTRRQGDKETRRQDPSPIPHPPSPIPQHLTYHELNARANQLAHYLRSLGVGPEVPVALCMERSLELVVGLLGVLKAGGAYLPLDPSYPPERLRLVLADSQAPVVLTQKAIYDLRFTIYDLEESGSAIVNRKSKIVNLDADWPHIAQQPHEPLDSGVAPDDLAYIIYTSGSTGAPKGVMVSHRGICNRLLWMQETYQLTASSCVMQKTPYSFDVSVWEFFWPLLAGARLVLARPGGHRDSAYLVDLIVSQQITTLHFVPTMLQVFLEDPRVGRCASLRRVICSGEALPGELQARFFGRLGHAALHNLYGPTEASVDVTFWDCRPDDAGERVPIGRPIANTQIWLLDERLQPVPIGVPGELYIGGVGLARGYLNRPDLTAERFIPNPFAGVLGDRCWVLEDKAPDTQHPTPNTRLYRTGDLARYRPDEAIEFLGRSDHQVKLRGFRIEPGEIEAVLARHPAVRESLVVLQPAGEQLGTERLVGYLVPDEERAAPLRRLLRWQREGRLADRRPYELPNQMVVLAQNTSETDFMYREIFEAQVYLRHGITLPADACVFDVGANIGLFSLLIGQMCARPVVYAFEPVPAIFELLQLNLALYGLDARLFACGLAETAHTAAITYYPHVSILSGRFANEAEERATVLAFLQHQQALEGLNEAALDELLADRLRGERVMCEFRTISEIIRAHGIERIDLLKIDAEKSELGVLAGIAAEDWPKIRQIVVEVHDLEGRLVQVQALFESQGYRVGIEQDSGLQSSGLYNVYAVRPASADLLAIGVREVAKDRRGWSSSHRLLREVTAWAREQLPEYMVPSAWVTLDALPLTPNGKLDRRLLPLPGSDHATPADSYATARTPAEELLVNIWAAVLGVERVGVDDNFFDLGGHSLLATQVVSRVREAFAVELPLRSLFEAPTVAELAQRIALQRVPEVSHPAPPIARVARNEPLPLSFAQQRLWFLQQLQPTSVAYTLPLALRLDGPLALDTLHHGLAALVARHEILRTTFPLHVDQPVQQIAPPQPVPLPLIDLQLLPLAAREPAAHTLAAAVAQRPFDLAHGPLLRALLLRLAPTAHLLVLTLHHLLVDGWSLGVLVRELVALYGAARDQRPAALPDLPIQYADYAVWQRGWLQGSGVRGQGSGARRHGDTETRRHGDTEQGASDSPSPTPDTQHPTPHFPSPIPHPPSPMEAQLAYWRQQLAALPPLDLPTDYSRPPGPSFAGASHMIVLPPGLNVALSTLSRREGTTLFMIILAAWKLLLARYSGQADIAVGTAVANRTHAATEGLIGFFVNTLVLRVDLTTAATFRALLAQVRQVCLDAYAHQDLPFEHLVEMLAPDRDLSHHPLFQVMLVLQNAPITALELPGLNIRPQAVANQTAKFDLSLALGETPEGLAGALEYRTDLFAPTTIARMAAHFQTLLEAIVADPGQRLANLSLLTDAERQQLLLTWNATQTAYPQNASVQQLFEDQAERTPDAVAVVFDDRPTTNDQRPTTADHRPPTTDHRPPTLHPFTPSPLHPFTPSPLHPFSQHLTYGELNARANQLGHYLRTLGGAPGVPVGVSIERSVGLVIGLLGILKAGGAYVPLDPAYPQQRLAFMLEDSQAPILLSQQRLANMLPHTPTVVCLDAAWQPIARQRTTNLASETSAESLAYIMYTSGSTGVPKGIAIPHRAITRLVCNTNYVQLAPSDRVAQASDASFDAATFEIWGALLHGACLVGIPKEVMLAPSSFAAQLQAQHVSTLFVTTALFNQVAREVPDAFRTLRQLLFGGEAVDPRWVRQVLRHGPPQRLLHVYGPTESTTFATWHLVQPGAPTAPTIPIGRPLANTTVYVLDRAFHPVPVGVYGELYLGGAGLAHSYHNRPDLTAERFIPNPFAGVLGVGCWVLEDLAPNTRHPTPNTRLYKTGDLVRYRADGSLEFLGRTDEQVKIRGFRIELEEIAAVLGRFAGVEECVVLAREDVPGERQLVAYVGLRTEGRGLSGADSSVLSPQSSVLGELRAFLKQHLPDYMIPAVFVALPSLPLTPSGKVDRRALPAPGSTRPALDTAFVAPRSPIEEQLAGVWAALLGITHVGVHDNFFELGGHSLLATQVLARVRDAFQVDLALRSLFEAPTVAGLSRCIAAARSANSSPLPPPILPVSRARPLPLSFAQQRLWFIDQLQPFSPAYNVPAAVRLSGALDIAALWRCLDTIMRRHEVLHTTFANVDGQPIQVIAESWRVPLPLLDLQALPAYEREAAAPRLAAVEAQRPFDLARGPLLRAVLLRLGEQDHVALLTMHHIASDGWSTGVLIQELAALYAAYTAGEPSPLPELPIQYADYAIWQRQWLQGPERPGDQETRRQGDREQAMLDSQSPIPNPQSPVSHPPSPLQAQLAYWRAQLAGLPTLQVSTDHPRPAVATFQGAGHDFALPKALSDDLTSLSLQEGVTLFMTLLAAWQVLLARYSGQDDIVVGTPIANRQQAETERLIGFFANTLVLRTDLSGNPSFQELLRRVREVCLNAYTHQDLPFEQLVEALQPPRDASRHPLFQVMLALQNTPLTPLELPQLTLQPLAPTNRVANFDLSLSFVQGEAGLAGMLDYSSALFDAAMIARMIGHFQTILEGVVADPRQHFANLPLLSDAERHQLLTTWNTARTAYSQDQCLHELFEAQVARTPDAVAVVFEGSGVWGLGDKETRRQGDKETRSLESGVWSLESEFLTPSPQTPNPLPPPAGGGIEGGSAWASAALSPQSSVLSPQSLTYAELNVRANRLARYLRRHGVGPDTLVGVCAERSLELMIALYGILKAGAGYLPLDPDYPSERLAFVLEDARPRVVLTTTDHRPPTNDQRPTTDRQPTTDQRPTTNDQRPTTSSDDRSMYGYDISYPNDEQRRPTTTEQRRPTTNDVRPQSKIQNPKSKIVNLDADWPIIAQQPDTDLQSGVAPDNLAYVIYTSGSTGKPKGAMTAHRGIVNRLLWMQDAYQLTADDRVLQKTPFSFDVSVWEFFWPLLNGAALVLARPQGHKDSAYLVELIGEAGITTLHFVPSMLQAFVEEPCVSGCGSLRRIICSGEALPHELQERCFARLPQVELHNLYGPTEASVDVTFWACRRADPRPVVPIGFPVDNTQMYVLDASLQPVPVGVVGELYIGGVQLARGYLGRPDLTAERFIPNPFAEVLGVGCWVLEDSAPDTRHPRPNTRLYRTGDLARYLADGAIEYRGRSDQQVKLRGFRIELGEIEAVLSRHPAVRECVVVAREEIPGDMRLVAYIVPTNDERRTTNDERTSTRDSSSVLSPQSSVLSQLRAFLKERLPDYMIPSAFVLLDVLPLTTNGKLDRRALPAPDGSRPDLGVAFTAPRTMMEEKLAGVWRELLGVGQIGIYDNFFTLGGHSLLLTQLVSRIRAIFQIDLPLRVLFDAPTILDMTVAIAARQMEQEDVAEVAQMLQELEQLSPDEIQAMLASEQNFMLSQDS